VRNTIAWANRDSTRAVSSIGSPRPSWVPSLVRIVAWPPSSRTATSKLTRVRVEAFSMTIATWRPASHAVGPCGRARFHAALASTSAVSCAWPQSARVMKSVTTPAPRRARR
jgi:hypothetical protein